MENMRGNWQQSIMDAVSHHDAAELEQLIKTTKNQSLHFYLGIYSPLIKAVENWDYFITEKLLCAGANVNSRDKYGVTPLLEAANNGNVNICRLLLKHGANVHATEYKWPYTALHYAALSGHSKTAALLLEHGAKIYDSTKLWHDQISPIRVVIQGEKSKMLNFLLEYCNKTDMEIPLPLIFQEATQEGSDECAIIALKEGYYPLSIVEPHITCFKMAADTGSLKLMGVLVELNPHFLQDDWLIQNQLPRKLKEHPDFCEWLVEYKKQPPCLQKLCRSSL